MREKEKERERKRERWERQREIQCIQTNVFCQLLASYKTQTCYPEIPRGSNMFASEIISTFSAVFIKAIQMFQKDQKLYDFLQ